LALIVLAALAVTGCGHGGKRRLSESTSGQSLTSQLLEAVPNWIVAERMSVRDVPGARLFAESGCLACHTYLGSGSRNVGGRDLSAVGRRHGVGFFARFVAHPERFGNNVMPRFDAFGKGRLDQLAVFLADSKGR